MIGGGSALIPRQLGFNTTRLFHEESQEIVHITPEGTGLGWDESGENEKGEIREMG